MRKRKWKKIDDEMKTCTKTNEWNRRNKTKKKLEKYTEQVNANAVWKRALNIYWIFWYYCVWFGCDIYSVNFFLFSCGWFFYVCIGACAHLYFASFFGHIKFVELYHSKSKQENNNCATNNRTKEPYHTQFSTRQTRVGPILLLILKPKCWDIVCVR